MKTPEQYWNEVLSTGMAFEIHTAVLVAAAFQDGINEAKKDHEAQNAKLHDEITQLRKQLKESEDRIHTMKYQHAQDCRRLTWKCYRQLKKGEMTRVGDWWLGPDDDEWTRCVDPERTRPAPDPTCPAHCMYRRHIAEELAECLDKVMKLWDDKKLSDRYDLETNSLMDSIRYTLQLSNESLERKRLP